MMIFINGSFQQQQQKTTKLDMKTRFTSTNQKGSSSSRKKIIQPTKLIDRSWFEFQKRNEKTKKIVVVKSLPKQQQQQKQALKPTNQRTKKVKFKTKRKNKILKKKIGNHRANQTNKPNIFWIKNTFGNCCCCCCCSGRSLVIIIV